MTSKYINWNVHGELLLSYSSLLGQIEVSLCVNCIHYHYTLCKCSHYHIIIMQTQNTFCVSETNVCALKDA